MSAGGGPFVPPFVTQTDEPPPWIDCTWAAALMGANKASRGLYPSTRAEREALRVLGDPDGGGSFSADVQRAYDRRYGHSGVEVDPMRMMTHGAARAVVLKAMASGSGALLVVDYGELPQHLRRWSPSFTDWHRVYANSYEAGDLWWMDPLGRGAYEGESVSLVGVDRAVAWNATILLAEGSWLGGDMAVRFSLERWALKAGTEFFDEPGGKRIGSFANAATITTIGVPLDDSTDASPGRNYQWRCALITTSAMDKSSAPKFVFIERPAKDPLPTSAEWDDFVLAALRDPLSFKWDDTVVPPPVDRYPEGWNAARDAAIRAVTAVPKK